MINFVGVQIQKLTQTAKLPFHGSDAAAGYDLYADQDCVINPGESIKVSTGIAMAIPDGYWGGVYARSGLATKQGLRPSNCTGVIDPDYRGQIIVALYNDSQIRRIIHKGDKIAQMIISPFLYWQIKEVKKLDDTDRGSGGFGSTGK